jgi:hypothetical protein
MPVNRIQSHQSERSSRLRCNWTIAEGAFHPFHLQWDDAVTASDKRSSDEGRAELFLSALKGRYDPNQEVVSSVLHHRHVDNVTTSPSIGSEARMLPRGKPQTINLTIAMVHANTN